MTTYELAAVIQSFAPLSLQEEWDNCGYNIDTGRDISRVLLCLDATQSVAEEARELGCEAVISHHPLFFRGVKRFELWAYPGAVAAQFMNSGISLYCAHTTMDASPEGINAYLGETLDLRDVSALAPSNGTKFWKFCVYVPTSFEEKVRDAAIQYSVMLGNYDSCTYASHGVGSFRPLPGSRPFAGTEGRIEFVPESRVELLVKTEDIHAVIAAVRNVHPYEEPAFEVIPVKEPRMEEAGIGIVGHLEEACTLQEFAQRVKKVLDAPSVCCTPDWDAKVRCVAVCGGAGSDLIDLAVRRGANVFLTGELKHNNFIEARLPLIAAGHFDTEKCFVNAMRSALQKRGLHVEYKVEIFVSRQLRRPYIVI